MTDITIEIMVLRTYQVEVDEDFDFEDDAAMQDYVNEVTDSIDPDTEDWESIVLTNDDTGDEYIL